MSSTRLCPKCGEVVDEGSKFCAHCGADITQPSTSDASTNVNKPYTGTPRGDEKRAIDHITIGYTVAFEHPQVFLPPLISGLLGSLVSYGFAGIGGTLSLLVGLVISVFSFILTFASIDMSSVPADQYQQVNRGFGNEFFVEDPSQAKVVGVFPIEEASRIDYEHHDSLPQNYEELKQFWEMAQASDVPPLNPFTTLYLHDGQYSKAFFTAITS